MNLEKLLWLLALFLAVLGIHKQKTPKLDVSDAAMPMRVLTCYDGDTCTLLSPQGFKIKVRLLGIDAPEIARVGESSTPRPQIFAREAREFLNTQVQGKTLPVQILGLDRYQRYLALIFASTEKAFEATTVNELLVRQGYAFAYRGSSPGLDPQKLKRIRAWAESSEKEAQNEKRGFWALDVKPQNPQNYRHPSG